MHAHVVTWCLCHPVQVDPVSHQCQIQPIFLACAVVTLITFTVSNLRGRQTFFCCSNVCRYCFVGYMHAHTHTSATRCFQSASLMMLSSTPEFGHVLHRAFMCNHNLPRWLQVRPFVDLFRNLSMQRSLDKVSDAYVESQFAEIALSEIYEKLASKLMSNYAAT